MIRPAKLADIPQIMAIARACAEHMTAKGIFQWNDAYPSKSAFLNDLERKELFVLEMEDRLRGTVVVSTFMDAEYRPVEWLTPNHHNSYIHRLAVHPDHQGQGHAQTLMDFAEKKAKKENSPSVRLDTFSQNLRNQHFYEKRGYQKLGDIYYPKQSEHPFHCYELVF